MLKIPLDAEDSFLILAPRWADLGPYWQVGLLAAVFVLPLILLIWLYRYEMRLISLPVACGLRWCCRFPLPAMPGSPPPR